MKHYLCTTALSKTVEGEVKPILLGPWCMTEEMSKCLVENEAYNAVPSPWESARKIDEASDYCYSIYESLIPELSENFNKLHHVSFPARYWQILIGPWLLYFVGCFYDRYKRMERALELYNDFYMHVLPREKCGTTSLNTDDFLCNKINDDYFNLKLFSIIAYVLCPEKIKHARLNNEAHKDSYTYQRRTIGFIVKNEIAKNTKKSLDMLINIMPFSESKVILSGMHRLSHADKIKIKLRAGVDFINFAPIKNRLLKNSYSVEAREKIKLKGSNQEFESILRNILREAIPMCYVEHYNEYRESIKKISVSTIIGSESGWFNNERFKFFAAEGAAKGSKLIEFQHGGGFGMILSLPQESLSLERDIFYSWGWTAETDKKIKPLPSSCLSRLRDTYTRKNDDILFVGISDTRYFFRFQNTVMCDNMQKYINDKVVFLNSLTERVRNDIVYRPYIYEFGWGELGKIKRAHPKIRFARNKTLPSLMQKAKMVVIDHPHTSFIEALAINVPCVFYWDHECYLMRQEAEHYLDMLRDAGILFDNASKAAKKVIEISDNPLQWWHRDDVQKARIHFCERFAYSRKDWLNIWCREFKELASSIR